MNSKYQAVLDAANTLYKAMQDYEEDLLREPNADATRRAQEFALIRTHVVKLLGVPARAGYETQAVKPERVMVEYTVDLGEASRRFDQGEDIITQIWNDRLAASAPPKAEPDTPPPPPPKRGRPAKGKGRP